jgi:hypothetical protein
MYEEASAAVWAIAIVVGTQDCARVKVGRRLSSRN